MNKEITLQDLKDIAASQPPLKIKELGAMLESDALLEPQLYSKLLNNYTEYMLNLSRSECIKPEPLVNADFWSGC